MNIKTKNACKDDVVVSGGTDYLTLLHKAWPIVLANAAVPLLGLVDTAVVGHFGTTVQLAGLAVAGLMFSFIYWGFGFLRMGTTAYVAQFDGAKNTHGLMLVVIQSMTIALVMAAIIVLGQTLWLKLGLFLLHPPENVSQELTLYFDLRIWGAPATLITYVFGGYLIGRGLSAQLLLMQLVLNVTNAILDVVFAGVLGWGIKGIAVGTLVAEYITAIFAFGLIARHHPWLTFLRSLSRRLFVTNFTLLLRQNSDIFLRTLFLLLGFVFFTRIGGSFGPHALAANHILLQLISFSAFFMDGFAFVLESLSGKAFGRGSWSELNDAFFKTSVLAFGSAILLAGVAYFIGPIFVDSLTRHEAIVNSALEYLPLTALYILFSFAAFQLDGLFIGAAYGAAMRNCAIISTIVLVLVWYLGLYRFGNDGLWWAFIIYVCTRAISLLCYLPALKARCTSGPIDV